MLEEALFLPSQKARETIVRQKLNPITEVIRGKKVAVVDDSIVRGTTSRYIVNLLKERGAKEVYFISASPPIKFPCVYGIDMSIKRELIAGNNSIEQVEEELGADKLIYQSIEDIQKLYKDFECCYACFTGKYPTEISDQTLD